jgi:hypothetical protein
MVVALLPWEIIHTAYGRRDNHATGQSQEMGTKGEIETR